MDIQTYAAILLVIRLISVAFIGSVVLKQLKLFKLPVEMEDEMSPSGVKKLRHYRFVLFMLACGVFIGNLVPIGIDMVTIFGELERSARVVKPISVIYTMTAAGTSLLSSYLIWRLYQLSRDADEVTQYTEHGLLKEDTNHGKKRG